MNVRCNNEGRIIVGVESRNCLCVTYQSPLPVLRPLAPDSVGVLPAAAEAKVEGNGEGMIGDSKWQVLYFEVLKVQQVLLMGGLAE